MPSIQELFANETKNIEDFPVIFKRCTNFTFTTDEQRLKAYNHDAEFIKLPHNSSKFCEQRLKAYNHDAEA